MIYSESKTARIFGVDSLKAETYNSPEMVISWLVIITNAGDEVTICMPYETALEYANAINGCNDREALSTAQDAIGTSEFMGGDEDNDEAA